MPSGGYRKPTNPAPASGPGAMSKRTDTQPKMQLPDAAYGEQKAYQEQQTGAPMEQSNPQATAPSGAGAGAGLAGMAAQNVIPFGAPSGRPSEPVTSGADQGAGPGSDVMNFANERGEDMSSMKAALPFLQFMANQPGSSWAARNAVRKMSAGQES